MSEFNKEKFAELLKKAQGNRTMNEFARQAGVSNSYISNLMRCKKENAPEGKTIKKIADAAHNEVTYAELLEAAGLLTPELEEQMSRISVLKQLAEDHKAAQEAVRQTTDNATKAALEVKAAESEYNFLVELEKKGQAEHVQEFIRVPVLGHIAAGLPLFAAEHIEDYEYIPKNGFVEGEVFSLEVKGDSMVGARIYPGDRVLVRVQPEVEDGDIAVVNVDGENATLKRVRRINGKTLLFAENPQYKPMTVKSEDARICGKVVRVIFDPNGKKI